MSLTCHPGWARTNLLNQSDSAVRRFFGNFLTKGSQLFGMSHSLYDRALPAIEADIDKLWIKTQELLGIHVEQYI